MANYSELLNQINAAIYENNDQEIDALEVRAILREMVTSLGSGFLFKGIATPSSPSGTGTYEPDQNVFYLATTAGTYTYLGGLVVAAGEVAFLCFDGTWTKKSSALLSTGSIVDNTTTEDATKPLSAKQGKVLADAGAATAAEVTALGQKVDEIEQEITESTTKTIQTVHLTGLKLRTAGITAESATYELNYFYAAANTTYSIRFSNSSGTIRFAYSSQIPAAGVSVTNYKTSSAAEGSRTFTPTENCYIIIANDAGFGAGDPVVTTAKNSGIGYDVLQLKQGVQDINTNVANLREFIEESLIYSEPFSLTDTTIADGSQTTRPAGSLASAVGSKTSLLLPTDNIKEIIYSLYSPTSGSGLAVAFYDSERAFISGLKSDTFNDTTLAHSDFPAGTKYIRLSTVNGDGRYAKAYCNKDLLQVANTISTFITEMDKGVLAPLPIYWAACGDSITHANGLVQLAEDDPYRPIDDYTDKPGYVNANSGAYPNYAYLFSKKHRMRWANYGYGGTILGEYIPKYLGENNLCYPFVGTRITQFKAGVPWNYISIMFGWNDNAHGPVYQKDKWLSETYGGDIGYPYIADLIGTPGFATQAQKDACDALGEAYFFDAFIGTINDAGKDTWCGAWNYALGYLMREYPDAKIMIMCPFIGGADRTNSQKFRASVLAIAEKFGVACFDFNDLEWWYYTTVMNSTPFANPDRQDGRWVKQNGETTPATIEGFNRARFCADSVHPTQLGHDWIADPIGYTLLQK